MTTKEILLRAAEIIEERGWWKYPDPALAFLVACPNPARRLIAWACVSAYLRSLFNNWTNQPERKAHHVTLALRATAYNLPEDTQ
jgi:hypothetical protein